MATIGIDIGTSSVRLCYNDREKEKFITNVSDITIFRNKDYISQSSYEIYSKILSLLKEFPDNYKAISIGATCSMVVLEKVIKDEILYMKPFSIDYNQENQEADIILWMDNRSITQSKDLNSTIPENILNSLGGSIIPEMGLPKLKWLSDNYPTKDLVAWELHDWFTYLLLVGGFKDDGLVPYNYPSNIYLDDSQALDGSIKGWSNKFLNTHGISIEIGQSEYSQPNRGSLYPIGFPLGMLNSKISSNEALVCHGCIDCYAGWISTIKDENYNSNTLTMVAGTSTCFIYSTKKPIKPIQGIWGPFKQLLNNEISLYEFGQPASGKLFETLFELYEDTIKKELKINKLNSNIGEVFSALEMNTARLEEEYSKPITYIIKDYFYYGDVYGNRSPYNDHRMSEMIIDGVNSNPKLASILNSKSFLSLTIRYNLTLEFLCFQTRQILDNMTLNGAPQINTIILSGSQANNARFRYLLSETLDLTISTISTFNSMYNGVKGASMLSLIGYRLKSLNYSCSYRDAFSWATLPLPPSYIPSLEQSYPINSNILKCTTSPPSCPSIITKRILEAKYRIYLNMCESQIHYRNLICE